MLLKKIIHSLTHLPHFVCPAILVKVLLLGNVLGLLAVTGGSFAVHHAGKAFGVGCAGTEHITVNSCGNIKRVCGRAFGNGNKSYFAGVAILGETVFGVKLGKSPITGGIKQGFAYAHVGGIGYPAVIPYWISHIFFTDGVKEFLRLGYKRISYIVYDLAVLHSDKGNARGVAKAAGNPPTVGCVIFLGLIAELSHHVHTSGPVPLAFLKKLVRIGKTVFLDYGLVVNHKYFNFGTDSGHIMLVLINKFVVNGLAAAPPIVGIINVVVYRLEHIVDGAHRESVAVRSREKVGRGSRGNH